MDEDIRPLCDAGLADRTDLGGEQVGCAGAVLQVDPGRADVHDAHHQRSDAVGVVGVAAFHINGQWDADDAGDVRNRLQQDVRIEPVTIGIALCPRQTRAGGGDGGRAALFDQSGSAGVPGVGQTQQALAVQVAETGGGFG